MFRVYLPAIETMITQEVFSETTPPQVDEHILFVDDEPATVSMIVQVLRDLGYDVVGKTDSTEALALFEERKDHFDLVITDLTMPRMTGEILAEKIMALRPDIPVILSTGYSAKMDEKKAMALGIWAFLNKPVFLHDMPVALYDMPVALYDMAVTIRNVLDG